MKESKKEVKFKYKYIGDKIKLYREKMNWSQDQFAEMLDMTRGNLSSYEVGRNAPPSPTLAQIADLLKVSTDYLLCRTDSPKEKFVDLSEEAQAKELRIKGYLERSESLLRNGKEVDDQALDEALDYFEYLFNKKGK